jgi:hypothetical protein
MGSKLLGPLTFYLPFMTPVYIVSFCRSQSLALLQQGKERFSPVLLESTFMQALYLNLSYLLDEYYFTGVARAAWLVPSTSLLLRRQFIGPYMIDFG